ncbi:MAG: very short patch repair endonuclease [Myxococcota bacterium]
MTDIVSPARRSELMRGIRGADTRPELAVRKWLTAAKVRYRLHRRDLPGRPDVAIAGRRLALFVHGCFWHRHPGCKLAYSPRSNPERWRAKFDENVARDARKSAELTAAGWTVVVIWECEVRSGAFANRLADLFTTG